MERTIEQMRAGYAIACVKAAAKESCAQDYRSLVRRFPAQVMTSGLGQALAFLKARWKDKNREDCGQLYGHIQKWVCGKCPVAPYSGGDVLEQLVTRGQDEYLRAQVETLALMGWIKRLAEATISKGEENE